ncbi:hypothetical protein CC2G_009780 [Coprinopsis cinerea AmutBmut pab1-1]|nr:hypothetical protein CC2G_009780 [Coprinopsis cinerea AmutBmut pab1-1]
MRRRLTSGSTWQPYMPAPPDPVGIMRSTINRMVRDNLALENPLLPYFPKTERQSIEKFRRLISSLDPVISPPNATDTRADHVRWETKTQKAYHALHGLCLILMSATSIHGSQSDLKRVLSGIMLENLEVALAWIAYILRTDKAAWATMFSSFSIMIIEEGELRAALINSPCAIDCAVEIYVSATDLLAYGFKEVWPVLGIIYEHRSSRKMFFDNLLSRPKSTVRTFVGNIVTIMEYVQSTLDKTLEEGGDLFRCYENVKRTHSFIEYLSSEVRLSSYLLERRYHTRFAKITMYTRKFMTDPVHQLVLADYLGHIYEMSSYHPEHSVQIILDLLEMDTLPVIADGLIKCQSTADAHILTKSLLHIASRMTSRRVFTAVEAALGRIPEPVLRRLAGTRAYSSTPASDAWMLFQVVYNHRKAALYQAHAGDPIQCQNTRHQELFSFVGRRGSNKLYVCSSCLSVTYCGQPCQSDDWDRVHRYECHILASDHRALTKLGIALPPRLKHLYLVIIQRQMDDMGDAYLINSTQRTLVHALGPTALHSKSAIHVSLRSQIGATRPEEVLTIEEYRREAQKWYLWSGVRFDSLVEQAKANEHHLVGYRFASGDIGPIYHFLLLMDFSNPELESRQSNFSRIRSGMVQIQYLNKECKEPCCM